MLVRVVGCFTLCSLAVVAMVFLDAAVPDDRGKTPANIIIDIADLVLGEPKFVEVSPTRYLIVLRLSSSQLGSISVLEPHVWNRAVNPEMLEQGLLVYWAFSTGRFGGCHLTHVPAGASRARDAPEHAQWLGGYWAGGCDASYDYAGRAIKNRQYAYSDYVDRSSSLHSPSVTIVDKDHISVTLDYP